MIMMGKSICQIWVKIEAEEERRVVYTSYELAKISMNYQFFGMHLCDNFCVPSKKGT